MITMRGVTLTEVVAAIALVTLAIGGIISVMVQSTDLGQSVDYAYVAANLAKNRIERIRQIRTDMGYTAIPEAAETDTTLDINGISNPNGDFSRSTVIDASYAPNLTRVTVSVKYKRKGVLTPVSIDLTTLFSPYS